MATNRKKMTSVMAKLMIADTFFVSRNMYLGTLIFVKMDALLISALMPPVVDSLKNANVRFPANRYTV